jgi:hypothetical protein
MLQKYFAPIFLLFLLNMPSYAETADAFQFFPFSATKNCQAIFYPESGLLTLPCLTIFPDSEPNYYINLDLLIVGQSINFILRDYVVSTVDINQPENAKCVAQFLPETGEVNIPCLSTPNETNTLYTAVLQINANLFSTYFI